MSISNRRALSRGGEGALAADERFEGPALTERADVAMLKVKAAHHFGL